MLLGRQPESAAVDRLLDQARAGRSGVLVLRGEPGVGKTAVMAYAQGAAAGMRVCQAAGVESEMELAFAGLHQLCAPLLGGLERLPAPQQAALETAFGMSSGPPPDRFFVGLAVLGLFSDVARERPLLCLIDDAQWLDRVSAQALAFVARRLEAESVAVLFATRAPREQDELAGLPTFQMRGLGDADARELLTSATPGRLDDQVLDRIVSETRGNPLALLELPRGSTPTELAGGFGMPAALPLTGVIEAAFVQRVERLPEPTRELLLVGAAEPLGDPMLLWRACGRLGIEVEAAGPAEADGLLELGARVRFRHPLVRSAVYRAASLAQRRRVHGALAEATDPQTDPDRRAWHRAQAAPGPDEAVAAELARSAGRARSRGGLAAAAAFLAQAAALTLDPARRAERALAAAQAKHEAGASDAALALLAAVRADGLDERQGARIELLCAQIAFAQRRGNDAPSRLLKAAQRLEPLDVGRARETYLEALSAAQFAGHLAREGGVRQAAEAARAAPRPDKTPHLTDLFLDGLAARFTEGYAAGAPILKRALDAFRLEGVSDEEGLRWIWLACRTAVDLWDDETWHVLSARQVELARAAGALSVLPLAITQRVSATAFAGELAASASLVEEVRAAAEATGSRMPPYGPLLLAAWQGREAEGLEVIEATAKEVTQRGEALGLTATHWATAVLCNGIGRYESALAAAQRGSDRPEDLGFANWSLVELIEAASRMGEAGRAAAALSRLSEMTRASGTDWALGIEARSRALLGEGDAAESLYREAIERLSRTRVLVELARARLVYGEWLRRERRRIDAREQLRGAHELFAAMGVEGFAERARRELLATGEQARKRVAETREQLTAQEAQIARLAGDGLSNPEIGARLFISRRTVEYHLSKVFTKLDIASRTQLGDALD